VEFPIGSFEYGRFSPILSRYCCRGEAREGFYVSKAFLASPLQPRPYEYQMAMEWKDDHHHAGEGISGACRRCICHRERSEAISRTVEEIASSLRSSQ
jgi:hypothetical protein